MPLRAGPHNARIRAGAAARIVCVKEERKDPHENLKNDQRMKERETEE